MPASIKHLTDKKLNLTSLLARWKDGLYYTAAIVKCDKINKRCLVCFEDGSEVWVNNRDVHLQLSLDQLSEDEDIVCCICDDGKSEPPNEIILCDVCQQGYHQKCHNPPVDSSTIDESDDHKDWFCVTCSYILHQSNRKKLSSDAQPPKQKQTQSQPQPQPQPQPSPSSASTPTKSQQRQAQQQQPRPQQQQHKPSPSPSQQQQLEQSPQSKPESKQQQPMTATQVPHQHQPQSQPQQVAQNQEVAEQQHATVNKTPVKSSAQTLPNQSSSQKTTVGPIKPTSANHAQKQVTAAPYYPLSNQVRVAATSSTAALASMTASSALVVGSSAGRTKQDLVNQSNRSTQQRQQHRQSGSNVDVVVQQPPVKHAVRKSSVNFVMPVRQSALPTATRSVLPNTPTVAAARSSFTSSLPSSSHNPSVASTYTSSTSSHQQQATTSIVRNSPNNKSLTEMRNKHPSSFSQVTSVVGSSSSNNNNNIHNMNANSIKTSASFMEACITSSTSSSPSASASPRVDTSASPSSTTSLVVGTTKSASGDCLKGSPSLVAAHHQGLTMFANNGGTKMITVSEIKNISSTNSPTQNNDFSNSSINNNRGGSSTSSGAPATISIGNAQPSVTVNSADSSTKIGQNQA